MDPIQNVKRFSRASQRRPSSILDCKNKPNYKVIIDGLGEFQMCTRHLADRHLQHLITIKIARAERIEDLSGKCDIVSEKRTASKNSP